MKTRERVVSRPCIICHKHFRHREIKWAFDCFGSPAVGCHSRRGIWYGFDTEDDREFRLEEPVLLWTSASGPGAPPICDDCVAAKDFDGEPDDVV